MKNIYIKLSICALALLSLVACKKENELAFTPSTSDVLLTVGQSEQISINSYGVKDDTAYPVSDVSWSIEDEYVAIIDANGVVTGRKLGSTRARAEFQNGKVCYTNVTVYSVNNQYLEPLLQSSSTSVKDYEEELRDSVRGKANDYWVYKNVASEYKNTYVIYFFNKFNNGSIVCFASDDDLETVRTTFLPDRYNVTSDNSFVDMNGNVAITEAKLFGPAVFYNFGGASMVEVYAKYKQDAITDIDTIASQAHYTQSNLGLFLPFVITADQTQVQSIRDNAVNVISSTTKFAKSEPVIDDALTQIGDMYMNSARKWALEEWCWKKHLEKSGAPMNAGLRQGHDQSKYSKVSWDRVIELDELATDDFAAAKTYSKLDQLAQTYGTRYMDVAATSNITSFTSTINKSFTTITKNSKSNYAPNCWTEMERLKDEAIDFLSTIYSYSTMNLFVPTTAANILTSTTSYYYDVPQISNTNTYIEDLESFFAEYKANKDQYSVSNWKKIQTKHDETVWDIYGSVSKTYSSASLDAAKVYMYNIPKKEQ